MAPLLRGKTALSPRRNAHFRNFKLTRSAQHRLHAFRPHFCRFRLRSRTAQNCETVARIFSLPPCSHSDVQLNKTIDFYKGKWPECSPDPNFCDTFLEGPKNVFKGLLWPLHRLASGLIGAREQEAPKRPPRDPQEAPRGPKRPPRGPQ